MGRVSCLCAGFTSHLLKCGHVHLHMYAAGREEGGERREEKEKEGGEVE